METKNIRELFNDSDNIAKEIARVEKYSKIIINKLALLKLLPKTIEQLKREIKITGETAEALLFYRDSLLNALEVEEYENQE